MPLGLCFWVIALVCLVFGLAAPRVPALAPYAPWPLFVLVLILGWHDFGPIVR